MATFENPSNGHREDVSGISGLWALLFGLFYFMYRGLWAHVAIQFVLIIVSAMAAPIGVLFMIVVWIGYAIAAPSIIANKYRSSGWREIGAYSSSGSASALSAGVEFKPSGPAAEKQCPRCAETIKAAAKVCRFCGYEFSPDELAAISNADARNLNPLENGQQVRHPLYGVGFMVRYDAIGRGVVRFGDGERAVALTELE